MPKTQTQNRDIRNEVNLGVMGVKINNIEATIATIRNDIKDLSGKIDSSYVTRIEYAMLDDRVKKMEASQQWIVKLVLGAVITAVLGFVLISR